MLNKDELLFVVDEDNNPLEPKPRREVHDNDYWHRTSDIWIINRKGQVLCQKRSYLKDFNPGMWESFFGGHLGPDEVYDVGAAKELREELGIHANKEDLTLFTIFKHDLYREFRGVFVFLWDGKLDTIVREEEEVDEVAWIDLARLKESYANEPEKWTPSGYEKELFAYLEKINLLSSHTPQHRT